MRFKPDPSLTGVASPAKAHLDGRAVPPGLVSQYLGDTLMERSEPTLSKRAIAAKVGAVVGKYRRAAGG